MGRRYRGVSSVPGDRQRRRREKRRARGAFDGDSPYDRASDKGIDGEVLVGTELESRLQATTAVVCHSIQFLTYGDVDHIIVGPGGVTVVDAKNWAGEVSVSGGNPKVGGWAKSDEVRKLVEQCDGVRLALLNASPELRGTPIRGVMCLAAEPDRAPETLRRDLVLCGSRAAAEIGAREGTLGPDEIRRLRDTIIKELPRIRRADLDELAAGNVERLVVTAASSKPSRTAPSSPKERAMTNRERRARKRRADRWTSILITGVTALGAVLVITHLHFSVAGYKPSVEYLNVSRAGPRTVASFAAPSGQRVKLSVEARHHRLHVHYVTAKGVEQSWRLPRSWGGGAGLTVRACVVASHGHCTKRPRVARVT
jgi:Nuclease-related domain